MEKTPLTVLREMRLFITGATLVSGTFGGIGKRGNVAIEQVLNGLRVRFGIEASGIDYEALATVTDYIEQLGVHCSLLAVLLVCHRWMVGLPNVSRMLIIW